MHLSEYDQTQLAMIWSANLARKDHAPVTDMAFLNFFCLSVGWFWARVAVITSLCRTSSRKWGIPNFHTSNMPPMSMAGPMVDGISGKWDAELAQYLRPFCTLFDIKRFRDSNQPVVVNGAVDTTI